MGYWYLGLDWNVVLQRRCSRFHVVLSCRWILHVWERGRVSRGYMYMYVCMLYRFAYTGPDWTGLTGIAAWHSMAQQSRMCSRA